MTLLELRQIAEAATSGPWKTTKGVYPDRAGIEHSLSPDHNAIFTPQDAEHIATFNPSTCLALLRIIEVQREALDTAIDRCVQIDGTYKDIQSICDLALSECEKILNKI